MGTGTATEYRHYIGGEWVRPEGTYAVVNPATEAVVGEAPDATVDEVQAAVAAARAAFDGWSQTSKRERSALLRAAADRWLEKHDELVPVIQAETGTVSALASALQVRMAAARLHEYADLALLDWDDPLPPTPGARPGHRGGELLGAIAVRQPVGVCACITPYNVPVPGVAGKVGPALAMGNTVVVKPAPQDPLGTIELARVFDEVGAPPGVVNVVTGSRPEIGAAIVASAEVDMVSFTGSCTVGEQIYAAGAPTMKRLLMELGGKGAALVLHDADLDTAAESISRTWTFHSGQACVAPTRVVVARARYAELVDRLAAIARVLPIGDPLDPGTVVGPVISGAQRSRIESMIGAGEEAGAAVVVDGRRPDHLERGFYVGPTLLAECTNDMYPVREEIFGPVVAVVPFDDEEEGIAIANDSSYGLYDYVFSTDTPRAYAIARRLRCGNVGINTADRNAHTPFGGFKRSGIGRMDGKYGMATYSELQSIVWPSR
ncbi:aldehyde dehydrogenase family protein [Pseudonocardia ailaonensis]|uniref:Aldehyde dehydrogenase family protein n=1 Tax=Pseudonocardia ailaonensis TaxID=367279 RepID=A0ABN2N3R4_9PSEU